MHQSVAISSDFCSVLISALPCSWTLPTWSTPKSCLLWKHLNQVFWREMKPTGVGEGPGERSIRLHKCCRIGAAQQDLLIRPPENRSKTRRNPMKSTVRLTPEVCRDHIETGSKVWLSARRLFQKSSNWWMSEINNLPWTQWFHQLYSPLWTGSGKESHLSDIENCGFQTQRTSLNH